MTDVPPSPTTLGEKLEASAKTAGLIYRHDDTYGPFFDLCARVADEHYASLLEEARQAGADEVATTALHVTTTARSAAVAAAVTQERERQDTVHLAIHQRAYEQGQQAERERHLTSDEWSWVREALVEAESVARSERFLRGLQAYKALLPKVEAILARIDSPLRSTEEEK